MRQRVDCYLLLIGKVILVEWEHPNKLVALYHNIEGLVQGLGHHRQLVSTNLKWEKDQYQEHKVAKRQWKDVLRRIISLL